LECTGIEGSSPDSATVRVKGIAAGDPAVTLLVEGIKTYTAQPAEIIEISWTVSDADTCDTLGGNAAWAAHTIAPEDVENGSLMLTVDFEDPWIAISSQLV
jgi:hypothetical protein